MSGSPWSDPRRPPAERIETLIAAMSVADKAGQLSVAAGLDPRADRAMITGGQTGAGIYSVGADPMGTGSLPSLRDVTEECQRLAREQSPHRIGLLFLSDVVHGLHTTFPIPLGLASSWDPDLVRRCAAAAAAEAVAEGLHLTLAPMIDIAQELRWGRVGETFGTEPELSGQMAAASVAGFQSDSRFAATAKHFVGYGLVQADRDSETLSVGMNALQDIHLRPFRAAVRAGCQAIMVGLHDVDGIPMHAHRQLIKDILKTDWAFEGVVISDWDGIGQLVRLGVAGDEPAAVRMALDAGVDLDLASGLYREHLPRLIATGELSTDTLDDAVRRVLRVKLGLGLLDDPAPETLTRGRRPRTKQRTDPSPIELAREAATASAILIKNAGGLLPLHSNVGLVHLCGPFAADADALLGSWVFPEDALGPDPVTRHDLADCLGRRLGPDLTVSDGRFSDLAVRRAEESDLTVAVLGTHPRCSGEDRCLPGAELPVGQLELLRELAALGKPLVVVVIGANPPLLRPVLEIADALLLVWHPGSEGAEALADLLLGVRSPVGRLPLALPGTEADRMSSGGARGLGRRHGRARDATFGHYLHTLGNPELSLGFGLTYTSFGYSSVELSRDWLPRRAGVVHASADVTNTGDRTGQEIIQLYGRGLAPGLVRPEPQLLDWRRVQLDPGQTARVSFKITARMFELPSGARTQPAGWPASSEVELSLGPDMARGSPARLVITS